MSDALVAVTAVPLAVLPRLVKFHVPCIADCPVWISKPPGLPPVAEGAVVTVWTVHTFVPVGVVAVGAAFVDAWTPVPVVEL